MTTDILFNIEGRVGRMTLNRPDTLNAVNEHIVDAIYETLSAWRDDDRVAAVLLEGRGDKALCAGGDLVSLYAIGKAGDFDRASAFWRREYGLNALIAHYPKPYVAFMHGFVMGGGVGLAGHGAVRIVTDSSRIAMPECSIGLMPDVGGTLLLANAPGSIGEYLGLTGYRMNAAEAVYAGFADLVVPADQIAGSKAKLFDTGDVSVLRASAISPGPSELERRRSEIDAVFSARDLTTIVERLSALTGDWAVETLTAIERGSPLSLLSTLKAVRHVRSNADIHEALRTEYRFVSRVMAHGDFLEGIRALIIDKDKRPIWRHRSIASVPEDIARTMLSAPEGGDLNFPTEEVGP